ncbi:MAG: hypothetical protein U0350_16840 [Caldilineaceae bacterium]
MSELFIRQLPDELDRKLRMRAKQNQRSVAEEVIVLLEMALASAEPRKVVLPQPFKGQFLLHKLQRIGKQTNWLRGYVSFVSQFVVAFLA